MDFMEPITAYVHFPWCLKKCPYCDFVSFAKAREEIDHRAYADAVLAELARRAEVLGQRELRSVFFGGGTPSLWEPEEIGRVLSAITAAAGRLSPDLEVTVECNPTSLDESRARALRTSGVNRLSVGVQGLDVERLRFLGRLHDPDGGLGALTAALRSGMPRVSGDLIYGVALGTAEAAREQRPEHAAAEARAVASTGVSHISAYSLTIEPGTSFGELARRGRLPLAGDDGVAETFFAIDEALEAQGFTHYEISNYARPGHEARHNLGYWQGIDYLGLGCAAFGTVSRPDPRWGLRSAGAGDHGEAFAVRYRNLVSPERYMAAMAEGGQAIPVASDERLGPETRLSERIMLGLRLREGFDLEAAAAALGVPAWSAARRKAAARLERAGRLRVDGGRLSVPRAAWVFADGTAAELF
ncbi:coproporphyrinogen III oxidase [Sorangium cellulosum]|uniref:Heme chaperone HemW n=1 Tax=Sorangium cellulosum TaxID=56 RepID=A0A4P2Q1E6_SORCE|nr:radical SAM family heme chaperone HemW [Sorangium cellulosum]AUX23077.1 coproporphyrinogen III oxidase [Sorangium cellulosum]